MNYIKEYNLFNLNFNKSKDSEMESILQEVKDIFIEYADKYDLKYDSSLSHSVNLPDANVYDIMIYTCITHSSKSLNAYYINLAIYFDDYFGSAGVDGYLGEDFQMDMHDLINRCKSLGLDGSIDWEGGYMYQIEFLNCN